MSLKDLEKMGLLKPEREWVEGELTSTVWPVMLATQAALAVLGCIGVAVGNGGIWTWMGLIAFLVALIWFIWSTVWAISRQSTDR